MASARTVSASDITTRAKLAVVGIAAGQKLDSQQEGSHVIPRDDWRLKKPKREPRPGEPDSTKGII